MIFKQIEQKRELGQLRQEQEQGPLPLRDPIVIFEQDLRKTPVAEHHIKQKTNRKVFYILFQHC